MRVPVTDAFDDSDQLESLEVKLTPDQIEWLEQMAAKRNLSLDHMLRTLLTAKMREAEEPSPPSPESGDSIPHSPDEAPTPSEAASETNAKEDDDSPSIVESLRSASERLQDLTEEEEDAKESDLHDTLARLRTHVDNASDSEDESNEDGPGTVLVDDPGRSMFDMVEE